MTIVLGRPVATILDTEDAHYIRRRIVLGEPIGDPAEGDYAMMDTGVSKDDGAKVAQFVVGTEGAAAAIVAGRETANMGAAGLQSGVYGYSTGGLELYDFDVDPDADWALWPTATGVAVGAGYSRPAEGELRELAIAPTDVLKFGVGIALLNGWTVPPDSGDGDQPARLYKQGGRAYMAGVLISPGGGSASNICVIPSTHLPEFFGAAEGDSFMAVGVTRQGAGAAIPSRFAMFFDGGDLVLVADPSTAGDYFYLDDISWPLAA